MLALTEPDVAAHVRAALRELQPVFSLADYVLVRASSTPWIAVRSARRWRRSAILRSMVDRPDTLARGSAREAPSSYGERLLLALSRAPGSPDYPATTSGYTLENALHFARKTIPRFDELIRDKFILDYGCGHGWQAIAMLRAGARRVVGIEIMADRIAHGRALADREGLGDRAEFHPALPAHLAGEFDLVLSLSAFEHFADPAAELQAMRAALKPGGSVVVSFAEPWLSPHGSHMGHFTRLPWVNVLFSERTVMRVRARFRNDGAQRYEEVEGGLNRMTLARFERIIRESGMAIESLTFHAVKRLPLVTRVPVVREFLTAAASCVLRTRPDEGHRRSQSRESQRASGDPERPKIS